MKNLASKLILGISFNTLLNCSNTVPRYENYFGNIPWILYQAKADESLEKLYKEEGGNPQDSLGFLRFQEDIYHKAKENNETSHLRWKKGKLEIKGDGMIWIRDLNCDGKAGKPKTRIKKSSFTYA